MGLRIVGMDWVVLGFFVVVGVFVDSLCYVYFEAACVVVADIG